MTNGLRVTDYAPIGERPSDIIRARTGVSLAGVDSIVGVTITGTPTDGVTLVYDSTTDTWILVTIASLLSGSYLTATEGEQHVVYTNTACGATVTLDLSVANYFDLTLTANLTITITNPPATGKGGIFEVVLRQGGSGSYTVTWPAAVKWQATDGTATGSAPTLHTAVGSQDDVTLTTLDGGTTYGATHLERGTVTSVAMTAPAEFAVLGSPVTSSGTFAITKATESANTVWAGPTAGSAAQPAFRALVAADIPVNAAGSDHEHVNNIQYNGDGATLAFELPAAPFDAYSVVAYVAGVAQDVTLSGTLLTTMTFGSAPAAGTGNVRVDIVAAAT